MVRRANLCTSSDDFTATRKKHQEEPVVIFQPINLVKEERAVLIGDERVDIFEHEHARSFGAGTLEDLPDTYGRMVRSHVGDKTRRP